MNAAVCITRISRALSLPAHPLDGAFALPLFLIKCRFAKTRQIMLFLTKHFWSALLKTNLVILLISDPGSV